MLNKVGSGIQTFTNGAIAFAGATNVNAGVLLVDGTETGASVHTVASGAALGGIGTILGNVTVASGGYLTPGDVAAAGNLKLTSTTAPLTLNSGSIWNVRLSTAPTTTASAGNDFVTASGPVALGSAKLNVSGSGAFAAGTYRIATATSFSGTLTFGSMPAGFHVASIAVTGGTGLDITFAANTAAQTFTWKGGNGTNNWNNAANWQGGVAPTGNAGETLIFDQTATSFSPTPTNDFPAGTSFASITVNSSGTAYTLSGNAISLGTGTVLNNTGGATTINLNQTITTGTIVVAAGSSLTLGVLGTNLLSNNNTLLTINNAGTLTINSLISGSGGITQATNGGVTALNGANTYGGATTITPGTVQLGNATALGSTGGATTVGVAATLDLNGQSIAETFGGIASPLINSSVTPAAITGNITQGATNLTVQGSGTISLSAVSGTGALIEQGSNTLNLAGPLSNTGALTITSGTVNVTGAGSYLGTPLNLNGGALTIDNTITAAHVLVSAPPINFNGGSLGITVTSSGSRTENVGALAFVSGANTINLNTTITGTIILSSNSAFVRNAGGGTLELPHAGRHSRHQRQVARQRPSRRRGPVRQRRWQSLRDLQRNAGPDPDALLGLVLLEHRRCRSEQRRPVGQPHAGHTRRRRSAGRSECRDPQ